MSSSTAPSPTIAPDLLPALAASGLRALTLAGRKLLPIVQGGMGVGVLAHRLAGAVAAQGGVGTLSSIDLRHHHPDLLERTEHLTRRCGGEAESKAIINSANLEALTSGPGIFLAGLSASLSFLPLVLTGFRGLMELGLIAGFGILFTLMATFSVLPALSIFIAGKSSNKSMSKHSGVERNLLRFSSPQGALILGVAGLLCLLSIWGAMRVHFDLNPLRLQSAEAESVVWEKQLIQDSRRSLISAAAFASSPEEVSRKSKAFMALPTVAEVESIYSLLPAHQEEKIPLLHALSLHIPPMRTNPLNLESSDVGALREVLARIRFKMQQELAAQQGADPKLVAQMEQVRQISGEILQALEANPIAKERLNDYRQKFNEDLLNVWEFLQSAGHLYPS